MALNAQTATASRDLALNAAFDILNSGFYDGYDSTQPTNANTALGAQVKLWRMSLGATAFAASASASKSANAITQDSSADATGTATWATLIASTRATAGTMDMSAGTATVNLVLNSASIVSGAAVSCSSLTITQAAT